MTWPGTPKNQQTPPINPPSNRFPFNLSKSSSTGDVVDALRTAFNGLTIHEQAFAAIPSQIASQAKTAATAAVTEFVSNETVTGVTSFNTLTGSVVYFPNLGMVNDELGNPAYLTQPSDNGKKIIVGDSSAVFVTLNPAVAPPWFTIIDNDSSSFVTITTDSGFGIFGPTTIPPDGFGIIFFDGLTFWCGATPLAQGISATITTAKLTGGGTNGSMVFIDGLLTAQTPAT